MKDVTVTITPAKLVVAGLYEFIHIQNIDATNPVYLCYDGDDGTVNGTANSAVTTSTGYKLMAGATLALNNDGSRSIFQHEVWAVAGQDTHVRIQGA